MASIEEYSLVLSSIKSAGSEIDLTALVETYSALLFRVAYSMLRSRAEAEDVVQDTFVRVLEHRRTLPEVREMRVWLIRIAWNLAIDRRRRRQPEPMDAAFAESLVANNISAEKALDQSQRIQAVLRELERLPKVERHILLLSSLEELDNREIAAILGRTESTVRALLFRAWMVHWPPKMPHILIVTGDAGECYEALYAVHRFREEDWSIAVAAPSIRRLHLVMHDFEPGWDTYVERPGYGLEADLSFDQINVDSYDAILILGGRAPEYLRNDRRLLDVVREFDEQQKWIFAICHGIQVLAAAGITKDKRITCYKHVRFEAEQAGATFVDQQAVRDGRMVTGQTWQSHPEFYREIFACLASSR